MIKSVDKSLGRRYNKNIKTREGQDTDRQGSRYTRESGKIKSDRVHWNLSKGGTVHLTQKVLPKQKNISSINVQMNKVLMRKNHFIWRDPLT